MGSNGEWLSFAEEKLKKENVLDYQSLLWEMGNEIVERKQMELKGLNLTYERELLTKFNEWFAKGGGKLNYVEAKVFSTTFPLKILNH